jgi:hypothetical protein
MPTEVDTPMLLTRKETDMHSEVIDMRATRPTHALHAGI